ncbi:uncharacterized protein Z519_10551 [Cladophialophora bantiana CBS 173.52]|uniref:Uncharacterized protein n=1 Tax=Cladophialophora bantiana (strain ATCC 10958 / CBS 173.52 / CDC B-1940 / NIH 8579) TaxID=1442370 RepID=A0A0D2EGA2_CLAB1|nr:uncharacterized protein Z519_10551 [Cladophialophora bantiana CBS 173.52]KIW89066.1 hypothetical protein Z519_10551 [Cladophialophora bantiana CBS 173.52]
MEHNQSNSYYYYQEHQSAAPCGYEIYILVPRAMYLWRGEPPCPPKLYDSLANSPLSHQPFADHPQDLGVAEFWESQTATQELFPIFESRIGYITPVHEYLPNMASYNAQLIRVREEVVSEALESLRLNPNTSVSDCYRFAVRSFLGRSVEDNILDLVTRVDLEVEFALRIIRATKRPQELTTAQMDNLQALGKSFTEMATSYRYVWLKEAIRLYLELDARAVVEDADQFLRYIGGTNSKAERVTGILKENGAEGASINPLHYGNSSSGGNRLEEAGTRDISMLDVVDSALSAPEGGAAPTRDNNTAASGDDSALYVHKDVDDITTWSKVINGHSVLFAQYQHGKQRPWKCLLCDKCLVNEKGSLTSHLRHRHGLTGLRNMRIRNENLSNFQGHDDNDCYMWGEFVENDPLPWKCLLCVNHQGVKVGKRTFPRHFQKTHGIKVILPSVTPANIERDRQRKKPANVLTRSLEDEADADADKVLDDSRHEDEDANVQVRQITQSLLDLLRATDA